MVLRYLPADRDQLFLLPLDMREWLPQGHLAFFVSDVVDELGTTALHVGHHHDAGGRPGYDPEMLLALLVYAYCTGVRSSRQMERLCEVDIGYRVICANRRPDHSTIARFRQAQDGLVQDLFVQALALCARAGLVEVGVVAVDGTKMGADASMAANRTAEQVAAMFAEAEAQDAAEDRLFGDQRGDELPPALADRTSRRARLKAALEELRARQAAEHEQAEERSSAFVEAERAAALAGAVPGGRHPRGREVARAEATLGLARRRAAEHRKEVERRCAAAGTKPHGPSPDVENDTAVKRARAALARAKAKAAPAPRGPARSNTTDPDSRVMKGLQGYLQGYNAQAAVNEAGVVVAAEVTQQAFDVGQLRPMLAALEANLAAAGISTSVGTALFDAGYWSLANACAPGPDRLIAREKSWKARRTAAACGPVPEGAGVAEAMAHRLATEEGRALYAKRSTTVEPVFGQLKALRGYRRFSRRGLGAVQAEWKLTTMAHNLLKLFRARQALLLASC